MEYAINVLTGTTIMFLLILVGYFMYRTGILNNDGKAQLSKIMLRLVCPALVFMSYQVDYQPELLSNIAWSFGLSALSIWLTIIITRFVISPKNQNRAIERFSIIYTNCGFMGIPLVQGVFGAEGVLYVTTYLAVFSIFGWSHGVMMMREEKDFSGFLKAIKNPTIIAAILGLICYLTEIRLPKIPADTLNFVADLNTPVAMFIAGATIAESNITKIIKNKSILWNCFLKLLALPVIIMIVFRFLPVPSSMVYSTVLIATACPSASLGTMLAIEYKKNAVYCAEIFAVSTLLSIITLPVIVILSQYLYSI